MTIFDTLNCVLFKKDNNCLNTVDEESEFSPFMLNRWISMYSSNMAVYCNTINKYLGIFERKKDIFNLFTAVIPTVPFKRINYIKRKKEEKTEEDINIKFIANSKELSQREIKEYIAFSTTYIKS